MQKTGDLPQRRLLALAALLVARYFRAGGGVRMLRTMNSPAAEHGHGHRHA